MTYFVCTELSYPNCGIKCLDAWNRFYVKTIHIPMNSRNAIERYPILLVLIGVLITYAETLQFRPGHTLNRLAQEWFYSQILFLWTKISNRQFNWNKTCISSFSHINILHQSAMPAKYDSHLIHQQCSYCTEAHGNNPRRGFWPSCDWQELWSFPCRWGHLRHLVGICQRRRVKMAERRKLSVR